VIITKHLDYFVRKRFAGFKILHILQRGFGNFGKRLNIIPVASGQLPLATIQFPQENIRRVWLQLISMRQKHISSPKKINAYHFP
jgi:hypothetical protein